MTGIRGWLATPLSFSRSIIWAIATIGSAALRFVSVGDVEPEQKIVAEIPGRFYDHMQTLPWTFTGGKTGGLMQRVLNESQNVQK